MNTDSISSSMVLLLQAWKGARDLSLYHESEDLLSERLRRKSALPSTPKMEKKKKREQENFLGKIDQAEFDFHIRNVLT